MQTKGGLTSGKFLGTSCDQIRSQFPNLTLTTEYDTGATFHVDPSQLLVDMQNNSCGLALNMLVNSSLAQDTLILGYSFLNSYNITLKFDEGKFGVRGYTREAGSRPKKPFPVWAIIVIVLVLLLIVAGATMYVISRKRQALR